jgi:hypothetical protein
MKKSPNAPSAETLRADLALLEIGLHSAVDAHAATVAAIDQPAEDADAGALVTAEAVARVKRNQAAQRVERARATLAEAETREAEDAKLSEYHAAEAAIAAASKTASLDWERGAAILVDVVRRMAELDIMVADVNSNLPVGASPLGGEHLIRGTAPRPREIINAKPTVRWVTDSGALLAEDVKVNDLGAGRGQYFPQNASGRFIATAKNFVEVTFRDGPSSFSADSLAHALAIPGFGRGEMDYFRPQDHGSAESILAFIAAAAAQRGQPERVLAPIRTATIPLAIFQRDWPGAEDALANAKTSDDPSDGRATEEAA